MCGRYGRFTPAAVFAKMFDASVSDRLEDRTGYNRPPGTYQLCGLVSPDKGDTTLGPAWWGFVPNWAANAKLMPINARSETAGDKKLFARAFAQRRALIPADYWIEWQRGGERKQPFAIRPVGGEPFCFADIWSKASRLPADHAAAGHVTFAILTGPPNDDIAHIHDRQPQALTDAAARAWLSPDETDAERLHEILEDGRHTAYESWPISAAVNKPVNDGPEILERIEGGE